MAHTGALAGSIETFDAISTREGVIRVRGLDELIETTECFVHAGTAKGQPPRRRVAVGRQARPADRRVLFGRPEFRAARARRHRKARQDARPRQHRRQSARRRICRGGRSLRLHAVDPDHDRRSRYRYRHHRRRTAEGAARIARTQSAHRQREGRRRQQAGGLYLDDVDRLHRIHQGVAQVAAAHRGHAGPRPRGGRDQVADRLRLAAQGSAGCGIELERFRARDAGANAEERARARRSTKSPRRNCSRPTAFRCRRKRSRRPRPKR